MSQKLHDELFRTVLLSGLRDAKPEHLKDILGDDEEKAHTALKAHNDALHGRMRGGVDQLEALTQGAKSHRGKGSDKPALQSRDVDSRGRKRVFGKDVNDAVSKILGE